MPVGWGCRGGGRSRRGRAAVLVVEHRSRRAVAARVAGCGGPGAASSSKNNHGFDGRGQPSGCVVVSRRRSPTAQCVGASESAWPLRRVRVRSGAEWRLWRTVEKGCVGVQWWRECGGCHRVRGGTTFAKNLEWKRRGVWMTIVQQVRHV